MEDILIKKKSCNGISSIKFTVTNNNNDTNDTNKLVTIQ